MINTYISRSLSVCFYTALIFIAIGFVFLIVNGSGGGLQAEEIDFIPVIRAFFSGNSDAAFLIAAFAVCLSPFFSAVILIVYSLKNKKPLIIFYSVILIILLAASLIFE